MKYHFLALALISSPAMAEQSSASIEGVVTENVHACRVDAACYFSVKSSNGNVQQVVYGEGRIPMESCRFSKVNSDAAWELKVGDAVKINAPNPERLTAKDNRIYLCEDMTLTIEASAKGS